MTALLLLLLLPEVSASVLRVETGHQPIAIEGRDVYMGYFTRVHFDSLTCVGGLLVHCLRPLTGAEEIDLLYTACPKGHWRVAHYMNTKEEFRLKTEITAKQLLIASREPLTIIDVQVISCVSSTPPNASCHDIRDHPHRHARPGTLRAHDSHVRRKRAVSYAGNSLDFAANSVTEITVNKVVPRGTTMTVHRGSILRFSDGVSLMVHGSLVVKGTKTAPVRFEAANHQWKGVSIIAGSPASSLSHLNISGVSGPGLTITGGVTPFIENVISDSNGIGFRIESNSSEVRVVKSMALNNRGAGFHFAGKASVVLDTCSAAANRGNGFLIQGSSKLRMTQSSSFSNQRIGVYTQSISNLKIEDTTISGNGAGIRITKRLKGKSEIEFNRLNISGHHYGPAILLEDDVDTEFTIMNCQLHDNYQGGFKAAGHFESTINVRNTNFTRNRGSTLSVDAFAKGKLNVTGCTFHANQLNEYSASESVLHIVTDTPGKDSLITVKDCQFTKNIMNEVVKIHKHGGTDPTIILESCDLHGNLAHSVISFDSPGVSLIKNFLHNAQSSCEISTPSKSLFDTALNFWGYALQSEIRERVCLSALNKTEPIIAMSEDPVVFAHNPLPDLNNTYNLIPAVPTPYTIDTDVLIRPDTTVVVEPGTRFAFGPGVGITIQEKGKLMMNGSSEKPIVLESNGPTAWRGVAVKPGGSLMMSQVTVSDASVAVWLDSDRFYLDNVIIRKPWVHGIEITDNAGAIVDLGGARIVDAIGTAVAVDERGDITLRDVVIENPAISGIDFVSPSGEVVIEDVAVVNSGSHGIHISELEQAPLQTIRIRNVTMKDQRSGHAGIFISGHFITNIELERIHAEGNAVPSIMLSLECEDKPSMTKIFDSAFVDNRDTVVSLQMGECGGLDMQRNVFDRNNADGRAGVVRVDAQPKEGMDNVQMTITNNDFSSNGGDFVAFLSTDGRHPIAGSFSKNRLQDNSNSQSGLIVTSPHFIVRENRFENPKTQYQLEFRGDDSWKLKAANNWWGTEDESLVARTVKAPEGSVQYLPLLTPGSVTEESEAIESTSALPQAVIPVPNPAPYAACAHINFCSYRGSCLGGLCLCPDGYTGADCSIQMGCATNCSNNGICNAFKVCHCYEGWTGSDCSNPICAFDCGGHGKCVSKDECQCDGAWKGEFCLEPACSEATCTNGKCEDKLCVCDGPWRGSRCDIPVCSACSLNGICTAPETCRCFEDWGGPDCSTCVGPSCSACDMDCDHGTCDEITRTCSCAKGWKGAACDICAAAGGCSTTGQIKTILPQNADKDDANMVITVYGKELPKTENGHYSCIFGMHSIIGVRQSSSIIRCPVPGNLTNGRHLFSLAAGPNVLSTADGRPVHFTVYDNCNPSICQGSCVGPICICPRGKTGVHCDIVEPIPEIDHRFLTNQNANTAVEGTPYVVYLPTMPGTVLRVNSSIPGLRLDSSRSLLEWSDPIGSNHPHDITVTAHSRSGESALSWNVTVSPSYKAIIEDVQTRGNKLVFQGRAEGQQVHKMPITLRIRSSDGSRMEEVTMITDNDGHFSYAYIPTDPGEYIVTASHPGDIENESKAFRVVAQSPPIVSQEGEQFAVQILGEKQCSVESIPTSAAEIQAEENEKGILVKVKPTDQINSDLFVASHCPDGRELIWITGPAEKANSFSVSPERLLFTQDAIVKLSKPVELNFKSNDKLLRGPVEIHSNGVMNIISSNPSMEDYTMINSGGLQLVFQFDVSTVGNGTITLFSNNEELLKIPYAVMPPSPIKGLLVTVCLQDEYTALQTEEHIVASLSFTNFQYNIDQTQNNVVVNGQSAIFRLEEGYYQITASSPLHVPFSECIQITPHNASFCIRLRSSSPLIPALNEGNWTTALISKPIGRLPFLEFSPAFVNAGEQKDVLVTVKGDAPGVVSLVPKDEFKPKVQSVQTNDSFWALAKARGPGDHCTAALLPIEFDYLANGAHSVVHSTSQLITVNPTVNTTKQVLCDSSGKPIATGTVTSILCNCDEGARATCRTKYRTATACGSAWSRIPDDTVSLEVLSTFALLISECRDVGVDFDELTAVLQCVSSLETDCPVVPKRKKRETSQIPTPPSFEDAMMADGPASIINHISTVNGIPIGIQPMLNVFNAMDMQSTRVASLYQEFFAALKKVFPPFTANREDFDKFVAAMGDKSELGIGISDAELRGIADQELARRWNETVAVWNSGKMDSHKGIQFEDAKHLIAMSDRLKSFARQNGATDPFVILHEYVGRLLQTPSAPSQECAQATVLIEPSVIYDGDTIKIKVLLTNTKERPITSPSLEIDMLRGDSITPEATLVASGIGVNTNNVDGVLSPGESMETSWFKRIIPQKALTTTGKYQPIITASFSVGGRLTKQRLKVPTMEIHPVRSAKIVHFVFPSIAPGTPFSVASSIMNIGYSTLENVETHTCEIVVKGASEEFVPYQVNSVALDDESKGNALSLRIGNIPSGESKMISVNISTNVENSRVASVHCPLSADGHILAVQESNTYIVQATAEKNGFMVSDGTGAMFFFRPEAGSLVNIVPLVYVASKSVDLHDPERKVIMASFRNEESRSFTGFLWGSMPLPEIPEDMQLVRVIEKANGRRDRQVRPITWIEATPGGNRLHFIDNGFASTSYQLTYEYTFADPHKFSVPVFDQSSYRIQMTPDVWWPQPPAAVGIVSAESFDGAEIRYALYSPDNSHRFTVDDATGNIIEEEPVEQGKEFCLVMVATDDRGQESRVPVAINTGGPRQDCILFNTEGLVPLTSHWPVVPTISPTSSGIFTVPTLPTDEPPTDVPVVSTTGEEIDIPTPPELEPSTEEVTQTTQLVTEETVTSTVTTEQSTTPDGGGSQESTTQETTESQWTGHVTGEYTTTEETSQVTSEEPAFTITGATQGEAISTTESAWTEVHTPDHTLPTIPTIIVIPTDNIHSTSSWSTEVTEETSGHTLVTDEPETGTTEIGASSTEPEEVASTEGTSAHTVSATTEKSEESTVSTTELIYTVTPDRTPVTLITTDHSDATTQGLNGTTDHSTELLSTIAGEEVTKPTTEESTTEFIYTMSSEASPQTLATRTTEEVSSITPSTVSETTETIHSIRPDSTLPTVHTTSGEELSTREETTATATTTEETTTESEIITQSVPIWSTTPKDTYRDACKKTSIPLWNLICELSKTVARRGGK